MRNVFGWWYPPGCSGPPDDDVPPCEVCGGDVEKDGEGGCICPECPQCGEVGDPKCYKEHGLERTDAQIDQLKQMEAKWREEDGPEDDDL